jgi:acyl dehydratase
MQAHGYQVAIQTVAGAGMFPHLVEESLTAFLEPSSRLVHPVFVGDTLCPALEVDELMANRTTGVVGLRSTVHSQPGVLVLDGRRQYLIRRRPEAATA